MSQLQPALQGNRLKPDFNESIPHFPFKKIILRRFFPITSAAFCCSSGFSEAFSDSCPRPHETGHSSNLQDAFPDYGGFPSRQGDSSSHLLYTAGNRALFRLLGKQYHRHAEIQAFAHTVHATVGKKYISLLKHLQLIDPGYYLKIIRNNSKSGNICTPPTDIMTSTASVFSAFMQLI